MNLSKTLQKSIVSFSKYSIIFLFVYTAFDKIVNFSSFESTLVRSPMIPLGFNTHIAITVIVLELLIVAILFTKHTYWGYLLTFILMILFNIYITLMLYYSPYIPCSCGGVISMLSWKQHLIFNAVFIFLAFFSLKYTYDGYEKAV